LASTGTAAFFLHPSEALHGDLGMLQKSDVLLLLAFGGETRETLEVARYAKRQQIPIIAITGKPQSSLAQAASYVLDGSVEKEACPLNLAPTSSTTVAMALGDALAIALMRARGFKESDFAQFHPDGSLGRQLSRVSDHMQKDLLELRASDSIAKVLEVITARNFGIAAVYGPQGELAVFNKNAGQLMNPNPKSIGPELLALDAVKMMEDNRITSLFVVDNSRRVLGLIRMHDLLKAKIV
jgi:arabinose-5-phosphate isomerase